MSSLKCLIWKLKLKNETAAIHAAKGIPGYPPPTQTKNTVERCQPPIVQSLDLNITEAVFKGEL